MNGGPRNRPHRRHPCLNNNNQTEVLNLDRTNCTRPSRPNDSNRPRNNQPPPSSSKTAQTITKKKIIKKATTTKSKKIAP